VCAINYKCYQSLIIIRHFVGCAVTNWLSPQDMNIQRENRNQVRRKTSYIKNFWRVPLHSILFLRLYVALAEVLWLLSQGHSCYY